MELSKFEIVDYVKHGLNIFCWHVGHDVVDLLEDKTAVRAQAGDVADPISLEPRYMRLPEAEERRRNQS